MSSTEQHMKFSAAALFAGCTLLVAPLLAYAYQLYVFNSLALAVINTNTGSISLPELPLVWCSISCIAGVVLCAMGFAMEYRSTPSMTIQKA